MDRDELINKYTYRVEWSEEDSTHIVRCLEFPSLMADGKTIEQALRGIKKVVHETVDWMTEENENVPEPFGKIKYRGNLTLRVPSEVHRSLVIRSAEEGVSVNQYILSKIS